MTSRSTHGGKSTEELNAYNRAIKRLKTESTVDTMPSQSDTDDSSVINTPISGGARPSATLTQLLAHWKAHWPAYVFSLFALILGIITVDLNREVGVVGERISNVDKNTSEIQSSINSLDSKLDARLEKQEDQIQQIDKRVQGLEIRSEYEKQSPQLRKKLSVD